jgi:hypothetical protein
MATGKGKVPRELIRRRAVMKRRRLPQVEMVMVLFIP